MRESVLRDDSGYLRSTYSSCIFSRQSELRPLLPLSYSWIDDLLVYGESDPACGLDLLALLVESPRDDCLGAIFICGGGLRWEFVHGIIEIFVIGPVLAAVRTKCQSSLYGGWGVAARILVGDRLTLLSSTSCGFGVYYCTRMRLDV